MADNVDITAGAGVTIHADEYNHGTLGSGKTQLVKLVDGTLDSDTPITVDIGIKANALRVCPASNISDATYIGDIKFGEALIAGTNLIGKVGIDQTTPGTTNRVDIGALIPGVGATNLGKAEDAGHTTGDIGVMALTVRQNTAAALSGTDADYQPLITDTNGRLHVLDANTANMLTALQIMDDWDDSDFCNVNLNIEGSDVTAGEGNIDAQTIRVTIATDDDGVAHLATIAGDTTSMDGKITACNTGAVVIASGTVTTVSTVTNLAQLGGIAITMDEGVHGAGVQRVTIATDDDGVLSLGIIDDWDATHASAASADGPQIMGVGYSTVLPTDVGADGDAARICTDRYGRVLTGLMPQNFQATFTSADAQSAMPVKAKTGSRKMYILSLVVSVDTEMSVQFQDDAATVVLIEQLYLAANGGAHLTWPPEAPLVVDTNKDFDVVASTSGNISVTITGYLAV